MENERRRRIWDYKSHKLANVQNYLAELKNVSSQ